VIPNQPELTSVRAILDAAFFAAQRHAAQKRKGAAGEPYINHLLEVAGLVAGALPEPDTNLVIAALLHDTIEDVGVTRQEVIDRFGEDVTSLVLEVTDDKSLPKAERKRLQVVNAPHKSVRAQLIKIADKISNLRAILYSPPQDWTFERLKQYFNWAKAVVDALPSPPASLKAEFDRTWQTFQNGYYLGYALSDTSRQAMLKRFPPKYSDVKADHVTLKFPAAADDAPPPQPQSARVIGYADSGDGVEAAVVEIDGSTVRPDGRVFHVTLSVDPSRGKESAHANDLLKEGRFERVPEMDLALEPKILRKGD
jgi:hypothetical protein